MTFCGSSCTTILLCLSIILVVGQILTTVALIILYNTYSDLKKKATECHKNLTLIATQTSEIQTETCCSTVTMESELKRKWEKKGEESPTRVPTPPSNRRPASRQQTPQLYRTQSRESQEMTGFPRDTSFTSARSRDSGTGSIHTRSPQSSISFESKMLWQDPLSEGKFKVVRERPASHSSQISRRSRENQNELPECRSSRLETMAIGMVGREDDERGQEDGGKSPDRVIRWGNRASYGNRDQDELRYSHSSRLQTMSIGMIGKEEKGMANEGYIEGSSTTSETNTMAGEELAGELNSSSQKIDKNTKTNHYDEKDDLKKKWHKDGEESPTRVPTPPPNRRRKGHNQNEIQESRSFRLENSGPERESGEYNYRNEAASLNDDESIIDTRL